jgi:hypothetical protein
MNKRKYKIMQTLQNKKNMASKAIGDMVLKEKRMQVRSEPGSPAP